MSNFNKQYGHSQVNRNNTFLPFKSLVIVVVVVVVIEAPEVRKNYSIGEIIRNLTTNS